MSAAAGAAKGVGGQQIDPEGDASRPQPPAEKIVEPPVVYCVMADAGGKGDECAPPASVCIDSQWLEYFTDGHCVGDKCEYTVAFVDCGMPGYACINGGCQYNFTL